MTKAVEQQTEKTISPVNNGQAIHNTSNQQ